MSSDHEPKPSGVPGLTEEDVTEMAEVAIVGVLEDEEGELLDIAALILKALDDHGLKVVAK